ncbi:hypothetical protein HDU99_000138, partial [Rhizoclosmatium hyalinum]
STLITLSAELIAVTSVAVPVTVAVRASADAEAVHAAFVPAQLAAEVVAVAVATVEPVATIVADFQYWKYIYVNNNASK